MCVMPAVAADAYHKETSAEKLKTVIKWLNADETNKSKTFLVVVNSDIAVAGDA